MKKEKVKVRGSLPNRVDRKSIKNSDIMAVIMTPGWVNDPINQEELAVAKANHVPIAALVVGGIDEKPYLKDADVIVLHRCPVLTQECINNLALATRAKMMEKPPKR